MNKLRVLFKTRELRRESISGTDGHRKRDKHRKRPPQKRGEGEVKGPSGKTIQI